MNLYFFSHSARLLLIDYGLNERTIQGICHGLDQLFSMITNCVGIQYLPMFGLIVNGQNQSEVRRFSIRILSKLKSFYRRFFFHSHPHRPIIWNYK